MTGESLEAAMVEWLTTGTVYEFNRLRVQLRDRRSLEALEHLGLLLVLAARDQRDRWTQLEALRAEVKEARATIEELRRIGIDQMGVMAELVHELQRAELARAMVVAPARTCRVCGCTDDDCSRCIDAVGFPCSWVDDPEGGDLCSRCDEIGIAGDRS